ncbi:MAG: LysR family transcriptional regulator [Burkholderiaceae bacterium]
MDIDLARTFIDVARSGSFGATADRLHVSQTTVTARIRNLEMQLGCRVFTRNRAGAKLTDDGKRFMPYANQLIQTWDAARRNLPLPDGYSDVLTLGAEVSLGNPLVLAWAMELRLELSAHAIRIDVGECHALQEKLALGLIDAAVVYHPQYRPNVQVEQIMEEKLIHVASVSDPDPYVYVDWGEDFRKQHDIALPEMARPAMAFNLGPLALQYILQCGGSGYFRTRVVEKYIERNLLTRVHLAPEFSYPVYLVYSRDKETAALRKAFSILRWLSINPSDWSQRWNSPLGR